MATPKRNLRQAARRDVMLSIHPQIAALMRAIQRSNSIYSQEQSALAPLPGTYRAGSQAILGNLKNALSAFGGTTGGYAGENRAATGAMNAASSGALGVAGAGQTSDLANVTAALQAAGMQKKEQAQGFLGQQQDIMSQVPAMVLSRLDTLRQQALQAQQTRASIAAQQAATQLAQQQFGLDKTLGLGGLALDQQRFALEKAAQEAELQGNQALADYYRNAANALLGAGAAPAGAAPSSMPSPYSVPGPYSAPYAYKPRP